MTSFAPFEIATQISALPVGTNAVHYDDACFITTSPAWGGTSYTTAIHAIRKQVDLYDLTIGS